MKIYSCSFISKEIWSFIAERAREFSIRVRRYMYMPVSFSRISAIV